MSGSTILLALPEIPPGSVLAGQLRKICEQEGLVVEPAALEAIARHGQGSLRDAESVLDMVAAFSGGKVTLADVDTLLGASDWEETAELFDALAEKDGAKGVLLVGRLVDEGRDLRLFVRRSIDHVRALVLMRATGRVPETASEQVAASLRTQAPKLSLEQLARIAKRLVETEQHLRTSEGTPLPLELAILDLVTGQERSGPGEPAGRRESADPARPAASVPRPADPGRPRAQAPARAAVVDLASRRVASTEAPVTGARSPAVALDTVRKAWSELVERTRERSVGKAAQLSAAEPVAIEGSTVVVGFDNDFARAFWQDKLRTQLEEDLSQILTVAVRVRCVRQPSSDGSATAAEDPMLRAALETLGRPERIMEIE